MIKKYTKGSKARIGNNFAVSEFACHGSGCCSSVLIDTDLVKILQQIRDHFGKPVTINSGYRCANHNRTVGGSSGSKHTQGMAADISVKDIAPADVAKFAESIGVEGIGLYETKKDGYFVHIDTRTKKSFWYGQGQQPRDTFGAAVQKPVETVEINLPVLQKGSKGAPVKALQIMLAGCGYPCGKVDGDFGSATKEALKKYQLWKGLTPDGICGSQTWEKLMGV